MILLDFNKPTQTLFDVGCILTSSHPVFASDAEVNIITVLMKCPDGKIQTIRAYREEAHALREFLRTST
jgi:hypothetical protein